MVPGGYTWQVPADDLLKQVSETYLAEEVGCKALYGEIEQMKRISTYGLQAVTSAVSR